MSGETAEMMMPSRDLTTSSWSPARFLRRAEAATYIQSTYGFPCSQQWLAKLAVLGGGPTYQKAGRTPLYAPDDLDAWANSRIGKPQQSTSDARLPAATVRGA
jgi:hypothetical protein